MQILLLEVLGKEPPQIVIWGIMLTFGVLGFFASWFRWYMVLPILLIQLFFDVLWLGDFLAPGLNPQIWREDSTYLPLAYAAMCVGLILPIIGMALDMRRLLRRA